MVPGQYAPSAQLFSKCVYKVLFLANHEEYFNVDGWPAENDRQLYYRVTAEIPLLQASSTSRSMVYWDALAHNMY